MVTWWNEENGNFLKMREKVATKKFNEIRCVPMIRFIFSIQKSRIILKENDFLKIPHKSFTNDWFKILQCCLKIIPRWEIQIPFRFLNLSLQKMNSMNSSSHQFLSIVHEWFENWRTRNYTKMNSSQTIRMKTSFSAHSSNCHDQKKTNSR